MSFVSKSNKQLIYDIQRDMLELSVIDDGSLSIAKTSGLQDALNDKQDILTFTNGNNISISQGIGADGPVVNISAGLSQIDTSILGFDLKQDKLIAGTNITISNNGTISSTFHGYNFALIDSKQDGITSNTDLLARSLVLGNVLTTPEEGDIITMGSITGANLNATNVSVTDSISCATLNAENISVRPNINITASFGKVVLGYLDGKYQSAGFAHINYNTPREYALLQTNDGHTYLNTSTDLHFKLLNEDKMIIKRQTGHVGIGTVTPRVSLDVANAVNIHSWGTSFNQDNNWVEGGAIHGSARVFKNHPVSIMGGGILSWNGFFSASDSRFKTNIQDIKVRS